MNRLHPLLVFRLALAPLGFNLRGTAALKATGLLALAYLIDHRCQFLPGLRRRRQWLHDHLHPTGVEGNRLIELQAAVRLQRTLNDNFGETHFPPGSELPSLYLETWL